MDANQLKKWRDNHGYTVKQAAELLDLAVNTYCNYERGFRYMDSGEHREVEIPRAVELACAAIAMGITRYKGGKLSYE